MSIGEFRTNRIEKIISSNVYILNQLMFKNQLTHEMFGVESISKVIEQTKPQLGNFNAFYHYQVHFVPFPSFI